MTECTGCKWCHELRLPEFADDDEMLDFFERHQHLDFPESKRSRQVAVLGSTALRQIEEARHSLIGVAPPDAAAPAAWEHPRAASIPLMEVFARRLIGAYI